MFDAFNAAVRRLAKAFTYSFLDDQIRDRPIARAAAQNTITVDEKTALGLTPVFACVRVISEDEATLPLPVYRRLPEGGKEKFRDHPLYDLLNVSPNGEQSAVQWRESSMGHVLTWGNSFSEIEFFGDGDVKAFWPITPEKVTPERNKKDELIYKVEGTSVPVPADLMLHFAGLGFDGLCGYSPIRIAKQAISLGLQMQTFGESFFANGARPGGYITHPGKIGTETQKALRDNINETHGGAGNFGKWMFLAEGSSAQLLSVPPNDAQFIESRNWQLSEICRMYRIPNHFINDLSHATFSNIEHQSIDYVVRCLRPWCVRIEAEINRKCFSENERREFFVEHLVDGLLRGDITTRYAAYAIAINNGWMNADGVCERENMNPLPDGFGKIYYRPLNMTPVNPPKQEPQQEPETEQPVAALPAQHQPRRH